MELVWLSDLHLDFVEPDAIMELVKIYKTIKAPKYGLITGDTLSSFSDKKIVDVLPRYLVYDTPFSGVTGEAELFGHSGEIQKFYDRGGKFIYPIGYLMDGKYGITEKTALVGVDGCGDIKCGNLDSELVVSEFINIAEYKNILNSSPSPNWKQLKTRLKVLGGFFSRRLSKYMGEVLQVPSINNVVCLMHYPPFKELCVNADGTPMSEDLLPFNCCYSCGEPLLYFAEQHLEKKFIVLCGHTHNKAEYKPLPNLSCYCAPAKFGEVNIKGIIHNDEDNNIFELHWGHTEQIKKEEEIA